MGIVVKVLSEVDAILVTYPDQVFNAVSGPLKVTLGLMGGIALILFALNHLFGSTQISYSAFMLWCMRYACIVSFATILGNFTVLRTLIVETPMSYGFAMVSSVKKQEIQKVRCGSVKGPLNVILLKKKWCDVLVETPAFVTKSVNGVGEIIDQFFDQITSVAGQIADKVSWKPSTYKYIFSACIVYLIGMTFALVSIFTLMLANIGMALMFGLAPLAIALLTFNQTRSYFESWLRLVVGFAVVPMLVLALMSIILTVAYKVGVKDGDGFFAGHSSFILISLAAVVFMFQVPQLAGSLSSAHLPQMAGQMANAAKAMSSTMSSPMSLANNGRERVQAGRKAAEVARENKANGMTGKQANPVRAGIKAMMQSAQYRSSRHAMKSQQQYKLDKAKGKEATAPSATNGFGNSGGGGFGSGGGNNTPNPVPMGGAQDYIAGQHR
jgi:type IV secretion system protein VirB6